MSPTRRQVLLAGMGAIPALSGCTVLSTPRQSLLVAVHNHTDSPQYCDLLIEKDDTAVVRQQLDVGAARLDETTVETLISLGEMADGTRLDVTASIDPNLEKHGSLTIGCDEYMGNAVHVVLEKSGDMYLIDNCFEEFPSKW
ncbi:MAG: hypothetical protein ACLFMX_04815 [Halobacteriales archaeon]